LNPFTYPIQIPVGPLQQWILF